MASRIIQVALIGTRVVGRAFAEAYKQAASSSRHARAQAQADSGADKSVGRTNLRTGMTLDEACEILNVKKPPAKGAWPTLADMEKDRDEVLSRYKRLFDANDAQKGGSFYLQSKVVRARQRLEAEWKPHEERLEIEDDIRGGVKLKKLYKER